MAVNWRASFRRVTAALIGRYPFINALSLLMLLGERAHRERYPPIEPKLIYLHLGLFIACGVCMSFDMKRREATFVHVGQLVWLAGTFYTNDKLKYAQWLRIRMSLRTIGVAAMFLWYSHFACRNPVKSVQNRRLGEIVAGIYLIAHVYSLMESAEDKTAFLSHVPGSTVSLYIYAIILCACALCYLPGMFVHDVTQLLVILFTIVTLLIDMDFNYWSKKRGLDFWIQFRLLSDNLLIALGLLMYLAFTKKQVYTKDD